MRILPHTITACTAEQREAYWDYHQAVRRVESVKDVLQRAAEAIVACGLYDRAVLSLHDKDGNLGPMGWHGVPDALIRAAHRAPRVKKEVREAVLQDRFRIGESYFVPIETGIDFSDEDRHIPPENQDAPADGWRPGDELFTPLRTSTGAVFGFSSADDPVDGRRPNKNSIQLLDAIVTRAAEIAELFVIRDRGLALSRRTDRLIKFSEDVVYEIEYDTSRLRFINPAVQMLTGFPAGDFGNMTTAEWTRRFVHPDDRHRTRALSLAAPGEDPTSKGVSISIQEYRILHRDGTERWVRDRAIPVHDADGQIVAIEGTIRDITALRAISDKLAKTEERYRLVTENVSDLVYAHDEAGHMFYVSPSVERYLGVTPGEFLGSHFSEWLTDNPINSAAFEAFQSEINEGHAVEPFLLEIRSRSGQIFLMEFNESLLRDRSGRVVGVQGVGRDVTDREAVLTELRNSRQKLDSVNSALQTMVNQSHQRHDRAVELSRHLQAKNDELESFVQIVSHDLRSPLITLRGMAAQLRRRYASRLDAKGQGITQQIGSEAARLTRLIGDLLVYARAAANPDSRKSVDLRLLLDSVWSRLIENTATGATLDRPEDSIRLHADPVALERVLENILSNALMHCPAGRKPTVTLSWRPTETGVTIDISDNGIGIEPEDRPRIYDLFYRGRNAHAEGSGLGLAIVKRITQSSGATIFYKPHSSGGSIFSLCWPVAPADTRQTTSQTSTTD